MVQREIEEVQRGRQVRRRQSARRAAGGAPSGGLPPRPPGSLLQRAQSAGALEAGTGGSQEVASGGAVALPRTFSGTQLPVAAGRAAAGRPLIPKRVLAGGVPGGAGGNGEGSSGAAAAGGSGGSQVPRTVSAGAAAAGGSGGIGQLPELHISPLNLQPMPRPRKAPSASRTSSASRATGSAGGATASSVGGGRRGVAWDGNVEELLESTLKQTPGMGEGKRCGVGRGKGRSEQMSAIHTFSLNHLPPSLFPGAASFPPPLPARPQPRPGQELIMRPGQGEALLLM